MIRSVYAVDIGSAYPLAKRFDSLADLITKLFPTILLVAGIIFFIMVVGAGFRIIMTAGGGDPHAQEQAKNFLTLTLTGFLIIFGAFWILQIINFITNGSLNSIIR